MPPERLPQPAVVHQQAMRRLPFDRLHHAARRQVRRDAQQQMDVIRTHVPLQNLDVVPATDALNLLAHLLPDVAAQARLPILRAEDDMAVHRMKRVSRSTIVAHGRPSYRKPPEGVD